MKNRKPSLAIRIRALRIARGLTQRELAALCGLHRNTVGTIERATANVTLDSLGALATGLRCSAGRLLHRKA